MTLLISALTILSLQTARGFAPRSLVRSSFAFSPHRHFLAGNVNVAEHELPLNQTNNSAASTHELSDEQLEVVETYKQLLSKKFPATMVRHEMAKNGNDDAEILRAVFDKLGDDDKIEEMTKPIQRAKKKSRKVEAGPGCRQAKFEDPTGFFPNNGGSGYVPAGLSKDQYAKIQKEEADQTAGKNYGAWGPRFDPSDKPVADDMAWMAMPDLWTGKVPDTDEKVDTDSSVGGGFVDLDPELPLDNPSFLSDARPWIHADAKRSDSYLKGWHTTYSRFCRGETVQQMVFDFVSPEKVVRHILEGATIYGVKDMEDCQTCIDLNRIGIYSPPSKSDWDAMTRAEANIFGGTDGGIAASADTIDERTGELMLCGHVTRPDFLRAIVQIGQNRERTSEKDDILDDFSKEDLQEMYLCMDWFVALRRMGVSQPFS